MEPVSKIKCTIDALFGNGISKYLPKNVEFVYSKKTGRIRNVYHDGKLLCTLRIDGGLAISTCFAQILLKSKRFRESCIEVNKDAAPFVEEGRSVFCKHVIWCGKNVRISSDTPVIYNNKIIAVGRAILSGSIIRDFDRGIAVKIRDSLKSHRGQD